MVERVYRLEAAREISIESEVETRGEPAQLMNTCNCVR